MHSEVPVRSTRQPTALSYRHPGTSAMLTAHVQAQSVPCSLIFHEHRQIDVTSIDMSNYVAAPQQSCRWVLLRAGRPCLEAAGVTPSLGQPLAACKAAADWVPRSACCGGSIFERRGDSSGSRIVCFSGCRERCSSSPC